MLEVQIRSYQNTDGSYSYSTLHQERYPGRRSYRSTLTTTTTTKLSHSTQKGDILHISLLWP